MLNEIPNFLYELLIKQYGEKLTNSIIEGYSTKRPLTIRINKIKTDWNNEETYHPIVRRRFAVQQLRRVHQIQTCYPPSPDKTVCWESPDFAVKRPTSPMYSLKADKSAYTEMGSNA